MRLELVVHRWTLVVFRSLSTGPIEQREILLFVESR